MSTNNWISTRFLAVALDPLHIGAGGQRLGRVDLTVVREPVTNVPKIPGTSLSGAIKFFLDLALRTDGVKSGVCASTKGSVRSHDRKTCPVCALFGYTPQERGSQEKSEAGQEKSAQGILQFSDGVLLAYPVNTLVGPVWVTTAPRLAARLGLGSGEDDIDEEFAPLLPDFFKKNPLRGALNFGWALLKQAEGAAVSKFGDLYQGVIDVGIEKKYAERMVVVSEWIFAQLVNSNMEIRTSVVIDPETGAASDKGLFTYEAVARSAIFSFDITLNDYADIWSGVAWPADSGDKPAPLDLLASKAFPGLASVGMGGMTTRGFGRLLISRMN